MAPPRKRAAPAARKERERQKSMAQDLYETGLVELEMSSRIRFPCKRYQDDPLAFFREILGVEPTASGDWGVWRKSLDLIEAVRDHDRVAVKAGRKVSKSWTIAGLALWYYCSFEDARVIMTSTTAQQVERVLWLEISRLYARSGKCIACKTADPNNVKIPRPCPHSAVIDGELGMLPHTGLKMKDVDRGDFREIFGFTSKQGEAVQGMSGTRMLYVIDEASGIPDFVFDAIEGNRAGGAKVILTGNPTRNDGEFYDAFHDKALRPDDPESTGYKCITISSEESPNVLAGREIIGGLATRAFIRERQKEWGPESPLYKIHVKGEFAKQEEGCAFSIHTIAESEALWPITEGTGRLYVGLDPAGESGMGDETCFTLRRGFKVYEPIVKQGLNSAAHQAELLRLLAERRVGREVPVVVMDRAGSIGADLYGTLHGYLDRCERDRKLPSFELVGVRGNDRADRQPQVYATRRDELCASLAEMMKAGLAIYTDIKLEKELHVVRWRQLPGSGLFQIMPKVEIKKLIGRSPDRWDSLQLACWEEGSLLSNGASDGEAYVPPKKTPQERNEEADEATYEEPVRSEDMMDPYGGL